MAQNNQARPTLEPAEGCPIDPDMPCLLVTPREACEAPVEPGQISALMLQHGSMQLRWYAPSHFDPQTPHDRDELYVVAAGSALFMRAKESTPFGHEEGMGLHGNEWVPVGPGDVLFVPAGTQHRFEAMSLDFGTWVIFYGPEGGEPSMLPSLARLPFIKP